MSMEPVPVMPVLEYRDGVRGGRGWGPWFFRPSRTSGWVFLLLVGVAIWVHFRHEPWLIGLKVAGSGDVSLRCPGRLITNDWELGIRIWDTSTCQYLMSIESSFGLMDLSPDGTSLFVVSEGRREVRFYDPKTGRLTAPVMAIPDGKVICISWTGKIILQDFGAEVLLDVRDGSAWYTIGHLASIPISARSFSLDGKFVLGEMDTGFGASGDEPPAHFNAIMEVSSHKLRLLPVVYRDSYHPTIFDNGISLYIARGLMLRDAMQGAIEFTDEYIPPGLVPQKSSVSADGEMYAYLINDGTNRGFLEVRKTRDHALVFGKAPVNGIIYRQLQFFPGSHRLFAPAAGWRTMGVYDPPSNRPVALFHEEAASNCSLDISADGKLIATSGVGVDDYFRLWRKVGWECRESRFGVLGMPHCWLLGVLCVGLAGSLWRDARRVDVNVIELAPPAFVVGGLLAAGAMGSFVMLLNFCLALPWMNPWPPFLVAGVGLATRGRGWRTVTLAILALSLPMLLYVFQELRRVGLRTTTPHFFFDRVWPVSHLWVGLAIAVGGLFVAGSIVVLARQRSDVG